MRPPAAGFSGEPALVPGELRGFRLFRVRDGKLFPLAVDRMVAWSPDTERAACVRSTTHAAPDRDCQCGIYGWYHPSDAGGVLGAVPAVIAASGRTILGDSGFRAAAARIEAVALPRGLRCNPVAATRARRLLLTNYPHTRVYSSRRRLLRDHRPQRVDALGIHPCRNPGQIYARLAVLLWVVFVVTSYATVLVPPSVIALGARRVIWLAVLLTIVVAHLLLLLAAVRRRSV
ncbi:MAG: hypothetical protein ACXV5Q_10555 [Frankiaceae bacterium]